MEDQPIELGKQEIQQREFIPLNVISREDTIVITYTIESGNSIGKDDDSIVQNDKERN